MDFPVRSDPGIHEKAAQMLLPALSAQAEIFVVGAGEGAFEDRLIRNGISAKRLMAADIQPQVHRVPGVHCLPCDLNEAMPLDAGQCDAVVALEVIEHLQNPARLITEAHRVLRPGGVLLLSTPNPGSFAQRVRFLVSGRFDYFSELDFRGSGHLHPIFGWWLERVWRGLFAQEGFDSPSFHLRIPVLGHIRMPRSELFCPNIIYRLRKTS